METEAKRNHKMWFARFLEPKWYIVLVIAGTFTMGSSFLLGHLRNERFAPLSLFALMVFYIAAAFLYVEARNLLKKIDKVFSIGNTSLGDLFVEPKRFDEYVQSVRNRIFDRKEYYVVFGIPLLMLFLPPWGLLQNLGLQMELVDKVNVTYLMVFWAIVASVCISIIWTIVGLAISLNSLGKEKANLEIYESIRKFKTVVKTHKGQNAKTPDFNEIDFSFGRLKEAIEPLGGFLYMLAIKIGVFGFLISIPPIVEYSLTGSIFNLTFACSCVLTGVLSLVVFVFAQQGMSMIWNNSRDEALLVYEQLCEQVKHLCVGSIVSSHDVHERENLEKDVIFIRNTIDDLKRLEATKFNASSASKLSITIFLPLLTVIVSRLIK